jgi:hypothetical protein
MLELLITVDELNIQQLVLYIQEYLIKIMQIFYAKIPATFLTLCHQRGAVRILCDYCIERICEEPRKLFYSKKFPLIKPTLLELILKSTDLNIKEIEIWEKFTKMVFCGTKKNRE